MIKDPNFEKMASQILANGGIQVKRFTENGKTSYEVNGQRYDREKDVPQEYRSMLESMTGTPSSNPIKSTNTQTLLLGLLLGFLVSAIAITVFLYTNGFLKIAF